MKRITLIIIAFSLIIGGCNIYEVMAPPTEDGITVEGRVIDATTGNGIADVRVSAIPIDMDYNEFVVSSFEGSFPKTVVTNEEGYFTIENMEEGEYAFASGHIIQDGYVPMLSYELETSTISLPEYYISENGNNVIDIYLQKGITLKDSSGNVWNDVAMEKLDSIHTYKFIWTKPDVNENEIMGYAFIIWNSNGPVWSMPSNLDTLNPEEALANLIQDTTYVFPPNNSTYLEKGDYRVLVGAVIYDGNSFSFISSEPLSGKFTVEE